MSSQHRRAAARRRAWGRGPTILRFEPLEGRQLLSADPSLADEAPVPAEVPAPVIIPLEQETPSAGDTSQPGAAIVTDATPVAGVAVVMVADASATMTLESTAPDANTTGAPAVVNLEDAAPETMDVAPILTATGSDPGLEAVATAPITTQATAAPLAATARALARVDRARPDLIGATFDTLHNLDWGDPFRAVGSIENRGGATTTAFRVDVVAARAPAIGGDEVRLGSIDFPAGLAAGEARSFEVPVALPFLPIPPVDAPPYVAIRLRVDAGNSIDETDEANNQDRGQGFDTSIVTITPHLPARLVGAAFNVSPGPLSWGDTVVVTAQVRNDAQGNAPATRARIVLTPVGELPGGTRDVTIGSLPVPALPSYQAASVTQTIALPAIQPATLAGSSQFLIWILMDADFQISPLVARPAQQGLGLDAAQISIAPTRTRTERPDLSATDVRVSDDSLTWGDSFQVTAVLRNGGRADAGPLRVRFLLTGPDGAIDSAIALGDATVSGLKANLTQGITQALQLPGRLPDGLMPSGPVGGRIVVQVDPENTIDETNEANNSAPSAPVILRLLSADGTSTVVTQVTSNPTPPLGSPAPSPAGSLSASPMGTPPAPAATPSDTASPMILPLPVASEAAPSSASAAAAAPAAATTTAPPARRTRAARPRPMAARLRARRQLLRLFPGGMEATPRASRRQKP